VVAHPVEKEIKDLLRAKQAPLAAGKENTIK